MQIPIIKNILSNRSFFMGVAMIMVVLYHSSITHIPHGPFRLGYWGVDIFILLSGYGLCYSLSNNNLLDFYKRRVLRLYPLYFIGATIHTFYYVFIENGNETIWDWFCDLTTLSYWKIGGHHIEWYISALFVLYIVFPFCFYIIKKIPYITSFTVIALIVTFHFICDVYWTYDCLIDRIPAFLFGILLYHTNEVLDRRFILLFLFYTFGAIVLFFLGNDFHFLWTSLGTPFLIFVIYCCGLKYSFGLKNVIESIGNHSLEIYVSQIIVMPLITYLSRQDDWFSLFILYFVLSFVVSVILITINQSIINFKKI